MAYDLDPETRQKANGIFDACMKAFQEKLINSANSSFGVASTFCESPIEVLLLAALMFVTVEEDFSCTYGGPLVDSSTLTLLPQARVGPYRLDFLLTYDCGVSPYEPIHLAVECDGHEFHERTKQQAQRDKQRDRFLQGAGYRVLRFTGAEIWADAASCAEQVEETLRQLIHRQVDFSGERDE